MKNWYCQVCKRHLPANAALCPGCGRMPRKPPRKLFADQQTPGVVPVVGSEFTVSERAAIAKAIKDRIDVRHKLKGKK